MKQYSQLNIDALAGEAQFAAWAELKWETVYSLLKLKQPVEPWTQNCVEMLNIKHLLLYILHYTACLHSKDKKMSSDLKARLKIQFMHCVEE